MRLFVLFFFAGFAGFAQYVHATGSKCAAFTAGDSCTSVSTPAYIALLSNSTADECKGACEAQDEKGCCWHNPSSTVDDDCFWYKNGAAESVGEPTERSAANCDNAGPPTPVPSFDGKTFLWLNTGAKSPDAYASFAFTESPPGEPAGSESQNWVRTAYAKGDAMPVMMKAVTGKTDAYQLKNVWADEKYQHWLTLTATKNGSRVFMESSATEANAFEFHVESAGKPGTYYFLTPDTRHYIGFCTSDCADGYWVTGDASTTSDAMAVQLIPVPAPTPPPTYPPTPPKPPTPAPPAPAPLPPNLEIEHVVMLMMENRPYDFFYGWADLPGAVLIRCILQVWCTVLTHCASLQGQTA
jgi:hypothetical protein